MNYYLVTAKCGHVGKGRYVEVDFPIYAETKSDAAQMCLRRGKVKKHLKNAISCVYEISLDEYKEKMNVFKDDGYVRAHTKKEIVDYIEDAQYLNHQRKKKQSFADRYERIAFLMKKNKIKEEHFYA